MILLLDTHVWLWMLTAPDRLGSLRDPIEDQRTTLLLSAASAWEISIKYALGRLPLPEPPERYVPSRARATSVTQIVIEPAHALAAGALPPHHRDPFDRILIAQAASHGVTLASADAALKPYGVPLLSP